MEEKSNERNNESRAPKMKIDEKMQQEGSKNDEKIKKIAVRGWKNRGKIGRRGASKRQQNARLKKVGVDSNYVAQ